MPLHELRPFSTISPGAFTTAEPSGTRHGVTADDDDLTYVLFPTEQKPSDSMRLGVDDITALTSGQRVKQYRLRVRDMPDPVSLSSQPSVVARVELDVWPDAVLPLTTLPPTQLTPVTRSTGWVRPNTVPGIAVATEKIDNAIFDNRLVVAFAGVDAYQLNELYFDVDVRDRPDVTDIEVTDGGGTDRCGGTVTDTTRPTIVMTGEYGYTDAPGETVSVTQQYRVFSADQVAETGFSPWVDGPWGPPRFEKVSRHSRNQEGVAWTTTGWGKLPPIENGVWHAFVRFGTHDFVAVNGDIWWAVHETCSWTQNFPVPSAPTLAVEAIDCPPSVELTVGGSPGSWSSGPFIEVQVAWTGTDAPEDEDFHRIAQDDQILDGSGTSVVTDRFVQLSYAAGESDCGHGDEVTRLGTYRVRLYGTLTSGGQFAYTNWTTSAALTVSPCVVEGIPCPSWIIHPTNPTLDWVGHLEEWPWLRQWPYDATQRVGGYRPRVVSGVPGGRDHTLVAIATTTLQASRLSNTLGSAWVYLLIADPTYRGIFVAAGAAASVEPLRMDSGDGALHRVTVSTVEIAPPLPGDPDPDDF